MEYTYFPKGVCSNQIDIEVEGNVIKNVRFHGGCNGNLKAISKLVKEMPVEDVMEKLEGNTCGFRPTSCADQLVKGLREALASAPSADICETCEGDDCSECEAESVSSEKGEGAEA